MLGTLSLLASSATWRQGASCLGNRPRSRQKAPTQISAAQTRRLWITAAGRHQLAFLLPAMAPAVKCLGGHPCGTGDFIHAFTVWWAHPLADLSPQLGVVRRLHQSWLGPLVDRSDRADNFAGRGGPCPFMTPQRDGFLAGLPAVSRASRKSSSCS